MLGSWPIYLLRMTLVAALVLLALYPPVIIVRHVTVTGTGISHLTRTVRETGSGPGWSEGIVTLDDFAPYQAAGEVCRLGHYPFWRYRYSVGNVTEPVRLYEGWHEPDYSLRGARPIEADSQLRAEIDQRQLVTELTGMFIVYVLLTGWVRCSVPGRRASAPSSRVAEPGAAPDPAHGSTSGSS